MNSSLYGKTIQIPDKMLEYLETCFEHIPNSDASIEGHKRNEELRNSGYVTYQQLGRIKHWFDNYIGDKTDAPFTLNGADYMKNWVDTTIDGLRRNDNFDNDGNSNSNIILNADRVHDSTLESSPGGSQFGSM